MRVPYKLIARDALTDVKIKNAKPKKTRYRLSDAHGLALEVSPAGGKHWRYRYRLDGKENLFAGGAWSNSPAGETKEGGSGAQGRWSTDIGRSSRCASAVARRCKGAGLHPRVANRARGLVAEHSRAETFDAVATEFIAKRGKDWTDGHRARVKRFLERDISPNIGALPIRSVQTSHLLALLRKVEALGCRHHCCIGSWLP